MGDKRSAAPKGGHGHSRDLVGAGRLRGASAAAAAARQRAVAPGSAVVPGRQRRAGTPSAIANDELTRVRKKRKKHGKLKKGLLIALAVVVLLVGGTAAYAAWYFNDIAGNIAMDAQDKAQLDNVITPVSDSKTQPFYALIVGSDKWENYGQRSDALVLVRIDPGKHVVTLVSVPRDTPYQLDGRKTKINQAFADEGAAGAVTAVQSLTGVKISYYAEIEFDGLQKFIDSIGGIYVDVPYTIDYQVYTHDQDVVHIEAGNQLLDGAECVALARMRTAYDNTPGEDATRQSNVRAMTVALLKNVLQSPPAEIPGLVQGLSTTISTNMDLGTMASLATDFVKAGHTQIYTATGPYEGGIDPATGLWLCYENPEGWASLMAAVNAGNDPQTAATTVGGK